MKATELIKGSDANALMSAGEDVKRQAAIQLGAMIGSAITLEEISFQMETKRVEMAKQIRDGRLWEQAGYKSWDECCKALFGPRRSVNRTIREFEERGADLFGISQIVRVGQSVYSLLEVREGKLIAPTGEEISINQSNATKIRETVAYYRDELARTKETLADKERAAEKAKTAAKEAKKEADKVKERLAERDQPRRRWKNADEDHAALLDMQAELDVLLARLTTLSKRELSPENQTRIIAFAEYSWAAVHQATEQVKAEYGAGLNAPNSSEWLDVDQMTAGRRDQVAEYLDTNTKR